ncbi:hypothetical protein Misp01_44990 [Microtetraspora sp. NBRC 13810]|uniref:hypothetical protein n=1 Tax=Microtetraspora sp. NBRC 13810 TaxID=3030990 RepID=UPI0024A5C471|nr:hypothetical protein [Microtetraspora sp. NBRC 13810]GLW09370.1 hypothetical protein Misp01_44990 [Microtetraspora sp. NBRC 13810]
MSEFASLEWLAPMSMGRVLVLEWTCACQPTYYELCQSGGLVYVRRTVKHSGGSEVSETQRVWMKRAYQTWTAVLRGQAR